MRRICLGVALLALLLASPAALAKESKDKAPEPKSHADKDVEDAIKRFNSEYKLKDVDRKIRILRWIGHYRHPSVLKKLKKIVMTEKDAEIQAVAAEGFGNQISIAKDANKVVKAALQKFRKFGSREDPKTPELIGRNNEEAQVLVRLLESLAKLYPYDTRRHKNDGFKDLIKFIDHNSDDVACAMFEYIGTTKEYRSLPRVLEWFNFYPDGYSWAGASAKVDTGTAGSADQKAAKAKALGKAGARRKKIRPAAWQAMSDAVKELTGKEMKKPKELKDWMSDNKILLKKHGL